MAALAQEKDRVCFFCTFLCNSLQQIYVFSKRTFGPSDARTLPTWGKKKNKPTMKTHNKILICFYLIKCSATKVSIVNNYHSITWIILVNMAGFKMILIFSCVFPTICIRKPPLLGQAYKEKWRWKLFHYLRRQPITYITFSNIHPSTPNVSYDLVRTHS